jgi:tetratricopeptide (TPR) repeat protein
MYRFNGADYDQAQRFFKMALRLDPTFARPHAGLSFTHFQNAFLLRPAERAKEIGRALDAAGKSLAADDRDPASHCAMGRAVWLGGRHDQSLAELDTAVALSPNVAVGHYTLAFVHAQSGDPHAAIGSADHSRNLSPFDPLLFAMLASRAIAHFRLGEFEEAAAWAVKAAARPNAHNHALAVAAQCLGMAGRIGEAQAFLTTIRDSAPGYHFDDFIAAFRFKPDAAARFKKSARRIGFH